ncbi:tRNA (adenosine(37)-N6)-threonylcarbamoyltransferase complex ATPase subunit type 1 TsaE [Idiomarina tyrosinivorans]|uniref:tRNA threonylcarbamoyladenosine biosynthesis protein TsaE n=1 Tax=Idiomarina tyrosinivorans TaxID=1445662 RepID=A0A432ZQH3_9GAMM|nr:tRNA (adenosine(37)-N6)-threonylcarbamoyltransferase complex ATPase subunit type 1 TsaE [Idiomarina tyrosinivorans]RUO80185.1 tRNA (adenosine(37)-N6)-threonylcarbamoyltransferase complex ATPase subunit type 1 TsaE [Idiomarina tyrosinivorans]
MSNVLVSRQFEAPNEAALLALAKQFAQHLSHPTVTHLRGELGAGKTTFTRGVLRGLGHQGAVKSPTYTLVEPYELAGWRLHHFDLYRLGDAEELEFMGIREYFAEDTINFIEWPQRGQGVLPDPDVVIDIAFSGEGRVVTMAALSNVGKQIVQRLC